MSTQQLGGVQRPPPGALHLESLNTPLSLTYASGREATKEERQSQSKGTGSPHHPAFQSLHTQAPAGTIIPAAFVGRTRPLISYQSLVPLGKAPLHFTPGALGSGLGELAGTSAAAVIRSKWISLTPGTKA